MARLVKKTLPLVFRRTGPRPLSSNAAPPWRYFLRSVSPLGAHRVSPSIPLPPLFSDIPSRGLPSPYVRFFSPLPFHGFLATFACGYRKERRRGRLPQKPLELDVNICIEEELPDDPQIMSIAEKLQSDIPLALKVALNDLKASNYITRDTSIDDIDKYEKMELSVLLCDDAFIKKLNKEWRDVDQATDVLSMSQHIPELGLPILSLGDVVISLETAARQAEERGYTLIDEIRILMVHGLLHLLGFDHEISPEAEAEMEKQEDLILGNLGWNGKSLIKSVLDSGIKSLQTNDLDQLLKNEKMESRLGLYEAKLSYVFCDVDGALFDDKSQINTRVAKALREAHSSGAKLAIITRKTRSAVIRASSMFSLAGKDFIVSEESAGVFLQGSLVYGRQGQEIYRASMDKNLCREAFLYSLEYNVPLVAFSQDRCLTLFEHPLVGLLHTMHYEPKGEIMPSIEHLLAVSDVQKLLFLGTTEEISRLKLHMLEATRGIANVVQAAEDMLEIVPCGASKNIGVKLLLEHLEIDTDEIMPHLKGENDVVVKD